MSLRLLLLLGPFAVANLVSVAFLPGTAFTFRCWEQLGVGPLWILFEGPFYPDQSVQRLETGDLGHHTPYAVTREVEWRTDAQGFRNRPITCHGVQHIVAGDSTAAGTSLTQDDMLASVLARRTGDCFRTLAPLAPEHVLRQLRKLDSPAADVLLVVAERALREFRSPATSTRGAPGRLAHWYYDELGGTTGPVIFMDRFARGIPLQWARGALRRAIARALHGTALNAPAAGPVLFLSGKPQPMLDSQDVQRILGELETFQHLLAPSTRLVVVPVPEKETILFDRLEPPAKESRQLSDIVAALNRAGVAAVDLRTPFRALVANGGPLPYQTDDSHWSSQGVELAAEAVLERLGVAASGQASLASTAP